MDRGIEEDAEAISFTDETFKEFKLEYAKALEENKESFIFQNKTLITNYAKYVIQHVETKLSL